MNGQTVDFDQPIDRTGTQCEKYDLRANYFGRGDVIPLWVADMDFAAPPAVVAALQQRAAHPVYGYSFFAPSLAASVVAWLQARHSWTVDPDWVVFAPGVVPSLHAAVTALTQPGDGIIVQPPIYPPFFKVASATERRLLINPLRCEQGQYRIDWDHLESCCRDGARALLLCSPHNPVGRVWQRDELAQLLALTARYGVVVVSDEIHADLVYPGFHHTPAALLAERAAQVVTAWSPSKTFNIPGLGLSCLIAPDAAQRHALREVFANWRVVHANPFSMAAFQAAYEHGAGWLDQLLAYLAANRAAVVQRLAAELPSLQVTAAQGTYLLWLNCQAWGMSDADLQQFFIQRAGLGLNPGISFGDNGSGYMRLNIGTPRAVLMQAMDQLTQAFGKFSRAGS